jgi:hypothetical protein
MAERSACAVAGLQVVQAPHRGIQVVWIGVVHD